MTKTTRVLFTSVSAIALILPHTSLSAASLHEETDAQVLQVHTNRYAGWIEQAFYKLEDYIYRKAAASPDWSTSDIPPEETGWRDVWTTGGLRARYCDQILIVYMEQDSPKGILDSQHRKIQVAQAGRSTHIQINKKPPLQWLIDGQIEVNDHWPAVTLPACMEDTYGMDFPSGRAARAGLVIDSNLEKYKLDTYETKTEACAADQHGTETVYRRSKKVGMSMKRKEVGAAVYGSWEILNDGCHDDYTTIERFSTECSWYQGEPFNKTMTGMTFWRRNRTVTAGGIVYSDPVYKSSTCWDVTAEDTPPRLPDPEEDTVTTTESRTVACPSGYNGQIVQSRSIFTKTITFPWDQVPVVAVDYSNWAETSNSCTRDHDDNGGGGGNNGGGRDGGKMSVDTDGDGVGDSPIGTPGDVVSGGCNSCNGPNDVGGRDDSGGDRVICTHLMRSGLLSRADWRRDLEFTRSALTETHVNGYHFWAIHVVKMMRRQDTLGALSVKLWRSIAQARANQIAFVLGERDHPDTLGRIVRWIGEPLCLLIGLFVGQQDWRQLYQTPATLNGGLKL